MTADLIDDRYDRLGDASPTSRAHAWALLRTIVGDAGQRRLIDFNPCHIRPSATGAPRLTMRTLDTLHVASAVVAPALMTLLTHDSRMADAGRGSDCPWSRPG